ncbi:YjeF N-terminal domain-containing protein [Globomyces pollinis-pini]|nr:YjeF N-terminal domain-containing protein [Globomyces pollinis-pini]
MVTYIDQELAQAIDVELMDPSIGGFSIDQLMELAGLSVAQSIQHCFPDSKKIFVCVGPGNNGGDALVASRHLKLFGYSPVIYYPKRPSGQLFKNLITQCQQFELLFVDSMEDLGDFDLILDGFFGFSFKKPVREPFLTALKVTETTNIKAIQLSTVPIVSIDIPSGWDVIEGSDEDSIQPAMLISLTLPKLGAKRFKGIHYLGGRFVYPDLAKRYSLLIPTYEGSKQFTIL